MSKEDKVLKRLDIVQSIVYKAVPRSWYDDPSPSFAMRAMYRNCFDIKQYKVKVPGPREYAIITQAKWKVDELCKLSTKDLETLKSTLNELDKIMNLPDLEPEEVGLWC